MHTLTVKSLSKFTFGDMIAEYQIVAESKRVGLRLYPKSKAKAVVKQRADIHHTPEIQSIIRSGFLSLIPANVPESVVQIACAGDAHQAETLRGADSTTGLKFTSQAVEKKGGTTTVKTFLEHDNGLSAIHHLIHEKGSLSLRSFTTVTNGAREVKRLELLSSFSLTGLSPFAKDDSPGRLNLHRLRCSWSAEGRHLNQPLEEINLEPSWLNFFHRVERFGQVGSRALEAWFPFVAVEDKKENVFWGAQIVWSASWQIDVARKDDALNVMGGLADRDFGHWFKDLRPKESFTSPEAVLTVCEGGFDDVTQRLTSATVPFVEKQPSVEHHLPIAFNEWCTTWGKPTHDRLVQIARSLKGTGVEFLTIDAGWFAKRATDNWGDNGDWIPNPERFPHGMKATCDAIKAEGLIPGIWFEFENVSPGADAYGQTDHMLKRDGHPLIPGKRFWDFRDPWVIDYLSGRVIKLLKDCGFGYLKIDYNGSTGIGVDGAESLGEGLRQHMEAVHGFIAKIRKEIPGLVIENCASGGTRLDPAMMRLCAQGSFSDAHESSEIPIIAANLHWMILPRQNQVWAVLQKDDSPHRLVYSLAAGFLGRLCLSGDYDLLNAKQKQIVLNACKFYPQVAPIIRDGWSERQGSPVTSWRQPEGWQAVIRRNSTGRKLLVVIHTFGKPGKKPLQIALPKGAWKIRGRFDSLTKSQATIKQGKLLVPTEGEFRGFVYELTR
ncbi:alpha-galactosidase [Oscillatoria laete-virens NRMC-F 0139]|nr:glycoside hydrolase family 36 protein [Oscillatoria laete-virens]MDL5053942.1 alpha-galactosidase [Oscillatoria laete-virens NRMC-F 0139]